MIDALEGDADEWGWISRQETTESAEGRAQAHNKAEAIKQFIATPHASDAEGW